MFTTADKSNSTRVNRQQQTAGNTFFRKAGENSFFGQVQEPAFFSPTIQAKLTVSTPDDPQEKEADEVADQVMRMPEPVSVPAAPKEEEQLQKKEESEMEAPVTEVQHPVVSRMIQCKAATVQPKMAATIHRSSMGDEASGDVTCDSCAEGSDIQRKHLSLYASDVIQCSGRGPPASSIPFEQSLSSSKGGGSALPGDTREFMENRFNADFSGVRIHTGTHAEGLSSQIHAQAFTHGNDIYFNSGKYAPHTSSGGLLLAHELTHTIQQGASTSHAAGNATRAVARKPIVQRSYGAPVSQLDNAIQHAKSQEGKIDANKPGDDGFRTGWQQLVEIFKSTFGEDKIVGGSGGTSVRGAVSEMDIKKKRTATGVEVVDPSQTDRTMTGDRDAMPSWCGIFVFWALNKSGVPMPKWKLGESILKPEAANPQGAMPKPGDIAWRSAFSHFAIVESVSGDTVRTVNGNTAGEDNLGGQVQSREHPISNWTAFFNPLVAMEGTLGSGEGPVNEKPKTLSELRRELFKVNRKEDGEQDESFNGDEQTVQPKTALSNWSVDGNGRLQTGQPTAGNINNNTLQPKEEERKEEEDSTTTQQGPVVQKQHDAGIYCKAGCCDREDATVQAKQEAGVDTNYTDSAEDAVIDRTAEAMDTGFDRGPPVNEQGEELVQRSVLDDALSFIGSVTDCISIDINEAKACALRKAQQVALHIPGYRALRVVLGRDPITDEGIERNGHNFLEAAFDLMPGGLKLHQKLQEQQQLDAAAAWIDTQIGRVEALVNGLFSEIDVFWSQLGPTDLTSPMGVLREAGNIVLGFIDRVIDFAIQAATELLEMIKEYLLTKIVEFIKTQTNAYPLLTVILGRDPVTDEQVPTNGTTILNALLELGGEEGIEQRKQMQETGTFQKAAAFIDEGIALFGRTYEEMVAAFHNIWNVVTIDSLMDPVGTFTLIYNQFAGPVGRVLDFVKRVGIEILKFIKEILMTRLSAWAKEQRGYELVTVIIGKDPFTNAIVERNVENLIRGFMSLMEGGREQFDQLKESGAIDKMVGKVNAAVARLNMTPAYIIQLFIDLWNSFSINDLANPVAAFRRIIARFGEPIGRLIAFVVTIVRIVIEGILIIMKFPFDLINNIIAKAMQAFEMIKRDPVGFLKNLLRAIKQGFIQFFDNILKHLMKGLADWLTSELKDAGVPAFTDTSLKGIIAWVMKLLNISMEKIWEKLAAHPRIGLARVAKIRSMINTLEGIWTFIKDVQERGMAAIWDKIQEQLSNLWETILGAVKNWIMEQIVNKMVTKLLSMLDPTGIMAVVNSAIALYSAIQSVIKYIREMLEIVNSFVEGVVDIASGNVTTAANYLERTLARAVPIIIGFLANQVGLNGIGHKVGGMIIQAQEMVDKALTWLVNKAVDTGFAIFDKLMSMGKAVLGWLGLRKEFKAADGHDHSLYFEGSGASAKLILASDNPATVEERIQMAIDQSTDETEKEKLKGALAKVPPIRTKMKELQAKNNADTTVGEKELEKLLDDLKAILITCKIDVDIPLTKVTNIMMGTRAHQVIAEPLTKFAGNTQGSAPQRGTPNTGVAGWNIAWKSNQRKSDTEVTSANKPRRLVAWEQVHLLHEELHGPGNPTNLTPTSRVANQGIQTHERAAIKLVTGSKPKVIKKYRTEALYDHPSQEIDDPQVGKWNTNEFPSKIKLYIQGPEDSAEVLKYESPTLPKLDADSLGADRDYYDEKKSMVVAYLKNTPVAERNWAEIRKNMNLHRLPASVKDDVSTRVKTYYEQNKNTPPDKIN